MFPYAFHPIKYLRFFILAVGLLTIVSCSSSKKIRKSNINHVVQTAQSYRGTPYRYGGATKSGMDCSALLYLSFRSVGVNLPRTSSDQSKVGKKVGLKKLEKGDVVFFATGNRRKRVTHAGIVTQINRHGIQFIHSSSSLGVTEDNLYSSYWFSKFVIAKRIF